MRNLLKSALDPSIIAFVASRASDDDLGSKHIRVFQNGALDVDQKSSRMNIPPSLISCPELQTVAVIDRTADLKQAATAAGMVCFSVTGRAGGGGWWYQI